VTLSLHVRIWSGGLVRRRRSRGPDILKLHASERRPSVRVLRRQLDYAVAVGRGYFLYVRVQNEACGSLTRFSGGHLCLCSRGGGHGNVVSAAGRRMILTRSLWWRELLMGRGRCGERIVWRRRAEGVAVVLVERLSAQTILILRVRILRVRLWSCVLGCWQVLGRRGVGTWRGILV